MKKIVVFASGSGTNAAKIMAFFNASTGISVEKIFCNNPKAGVLARAASQGVSTRVFNREEYNTKIIHELKEIAPDLIVLAGFLWKIPTSYLTAFPNKIINIHPSLLPKYGGKGMYGQHVFDAIVANNEAESGITIHYVNEHYDQGAIIFQAKTAVSPDDSAAAVAEKTHALEHAHFAPQIHKLLQQ